MDDTNGEYSTIRRGYRVLGSDYKQMHRIWLYHSKFIDKIVLRNKVVEKHSPFDAQYTGTAFQIHDQNSLDEKVGTFKLTHSD